MALASITIAFAISEANYDCDGIWYQSWHHPHHLIDGFKLKLGKIGLKRVKKFEIGSKVGGSGRVPKPACVAEISTYWSIFKPQCNSGSRWAIEDPKKGKSSEFEAEDIWWPHQIRSSFEGIVTQGLDSYLKKSVSKASQGLEDTNILNQLQN